MDYTKLSRGELQDTLRKKLIDEEASHAPFTGGSFDIYKDSLVQLLQRLETRSFVLSGERPEYRVSRYWSYNRDMCAYLGIQVTSYPKALLEATANWVEKHVYFNNQYDEEKFLGADASVTYKG